MSDDFITGLFFKKPSDKAPDFVISNGSMKVVELGKFLKEAYQNGDEWVNFDLKVSRDGKHYAQINTWKPDGGKGGGGQDDVPFNRIRDEYCF